MSAETKQEAIKKLDNIKIRVGYQPDEEQEDEKRTVVGNAADALAYWTVGKEIHAGH